MKRNDDMILRKIAQERRDCLRQLEELLKEMTVEELQEVKKKLVEILKRRGE